MFNFDLDEKSDMRKAKREKKKEKGKKNELKNKERRKKSGKKKKYCTEWQVWIPQTMWKILSDDKWVMVLNGCGILKWWMTEIEWLKKTIKTASKLTQTHFLSLAIP